MKSYKRIVNGDLGKVKPDEISFIGLWFYLLYL